MYIFELPETREQNPIYLLMQYHWCFVYFCFAVLNLTIATSSFVTLTFPPEVTGICVDNTNTPPEIGTLYVTSPETPPVPESLYNHLQCYTQPFLLQFSSDSTPGTDTFDFTIQGTGELYQYDVTVTGWKLIAFLEI